MNLRSGFTRETTHVRDTGLTHQNSMDLIGTAVACMSLGLYFDIVQSINMMSILGIYRIWKVTNLLKGNGYTCRGRV
jgi:hypothetical protein